MSEVKELNDKAKLVGINHVALEVGSIDEALSFYALHYRNRRGRAVVNSRCFLMALSAAMTVLEKGKLTRRLILV